MTIESTPSTTAEEAATRSGAIPLARAATPGEGFDAPALLAFALGLCVCFLASYASRLPSQAVVVVWLPVGWSLGGFLLIDRRDWGKLIPILFVVDLAITLGVEQQHYAWYWGVGYTLLNIAEPLLIAVALRHYFGTALDTFTPAAFSRFALIAAIGAPALAALVGAGMVVYIEPHRTFSGEWQRWWIGDGLGVLLITPLLLAWAGESRRRTAVSRGRRTEAIVMFTLLIIVGQLALGRPPTPVMTVLDVPHIVVPFLTWAAVRFGRRLFTLALAVVSAQLVTEIILGGGPFNGPGRTPHDVILSSQMFLAITAGSTLFLSSYVITHRRLDLIRQRFEQFAGLLTDVLWIYSRRSGRFLYLSPAYERLTGQPLTRGIADPEAWLAAVHEEDRERVTAAWARRNNVEASSTADLEFRVRDPQGRVRWIWARWTEESDPRTGERVLVGSDRDMTAERELEHQQRGLEEELHAAKRFEAIGMVSAGVAHDLKNVVQLVISHADLLSLSAAPESEEGQSAKDLSEAAGRVGRLARSLLSFGGGQADSGPTDLVTAVAEGAELVRRMLPGQVRFDLQQAPAPIWVGLASGEVHQILLNLVLNARDAIGGEGRISVLVENAGPIARLTVTDSGSGVSAEVRDRLFVPFVTTKPEKGTGLGLATVNRLAQKGGGRVLLSPNAGQGSQFIVELLQVPQGSRHPPG